jgi:hypothetical protein
VAYTGWMSGFIGVSFLVRVELRTIAKSGRVNKLAASWAVSPFDCNGFSGAR